CFLFKTIKTRNTATLFLIFMKILTELSTVLWVTLLSV
ncbi:hypothetical protein, partial [uncultured Gammaproteobacteria bacterium]